jgi:DNA gyrase subunit B
VQFAALMDAMGTQIGDEFDLSKIRYQRIILLFDPDADGIHGRTLLLLFFHKWMKPLLDSGRIFDVQVPCWKLDSKKLDSPKFASTDEQFQELKTRLESEGIDDLKTTRFRGIGRVGEDTLSNFCTNPETRHLSLLPSEDAEDAIRFFEQLRSIMHPDG